MRLRLPESMNAARVARVLLDARALLVRDGWVSEYVDDWGRLRQKIPGEGWTLWIVVADGTIHGWHARRVLELLAGDTLPRWNSHPRRTGTEAVALVDKALRTLGFAVPRTRYRERNRRRAGRAGGWTISPWGATRELSQGSEGSGVDGMGPPASEPSLLRATGVPGMNTETKSVCSGETVSEAAKRYTDLSLEQLARDAAFHFALVTELQRALVARAKVELPEGTAVNETAPLLLAQLENGQYQFGSQIRFVKHAKAIIETAQNFGFNVAPKDGGRG